MRLFRRTRPPPADGPGRESARALEASQERLRAERDQLVIPMRRMIEQNNVTELVRELVRRTGEAHGHGTAAG